MKNSKGNIEQDAKTKKISYKGISKLAGVSISTVSRFFNNGYISDKTTNKIQSIINKYGYIPNYGASIVRGKSRTIFVIMPNAIQNKFNLITSGLVLESAKNDWHVVTTYSETASNDYIATIKYALSWKPLAIVALIPDYHKRVFDYLKNISKETAIVIYGHNIDDLNWIKTDFETSFYNSVEVFKHNRNQQLALILDEKLSDTEKNEIKNGFNAACQKNDLNCSIYYLETKKNWINIQNLNKKLKFAGIKNIVCSTHEVYVSIMNTLGNKEFKMTDIGYQSIFDVVKNYKAKIFVDYPKIGMMIIRMIHDYLETQQQEGVLVDTLIIEDEKNRSKYD